MNTTRIIKVFLASSITELKDERQCISSLGDDISNLFSHDEIIVRFVKCENIHAGNIGNHDQEIIDQNIRRCDLSIFIFKTKAGEWTLHEYDIARAIQQEQGHKIFVYFLRVPEEEMSGSLKDLKQRLEKDGVYWKECDTLGDAKLNFSMGILAHINITSGIEEYGDDDIFEQYQRAKVQQNQRQHKLHKVIEDVLLLKVPSVLNDKNRLISDRIIETIGIYQKADLWASETDYNKEKYSELLYNYAKFMYDYGLYWDALEIILKQIKIKPNSAKSYICQGNILFCLDKYKESLDVFQTALTKLSETNRSDLSLMADIYDNIGKVYNRMGKSDKATELATKSLKIRESKEENTITNSSHALENIAYGLWMQGNSKKALEYHEKALGIEIKINGENSPRVAILYRAIGDDYRGIDNNDEALTYYLKAQKIFEKTLGEKHPETALTYGCIGVAYMELKKYQEAIDFTKKGLTIREEMFGSEHTQTAESYFWLGEIYSQPGKKQDFNKALEYYGKARAIREKKYGRSHYETLCVDYCIAELYVNQGDYLKAIDIFKEELDYLEKQDEHEPMTVAYYYLGIIYMSAEKFENAIESLNKSIFFSVKEDYILGSAQIILADIYNTLNDPLKAIDHNIKALRIMEINQLENDDFAYMWSHIGDIYRKIKDYNIAKEYYLIALEKQEKIQKDSQGTADIYIKIGDVYLIMECYTESLTYYNKALDILLTLFRSNDTSVASAYRSIGLMYNNKSDYFKAVECFQKALEIDEIILGKDNIVTATDYQNIAEMYDNQGEYGKALDYYRKALVIHEKVYGEESVNSATDQNSIGLIYWKQGNYTKALECYFKSLEIFERIYGLEHINISSIFDNIGLAYRDQYDYSKALDFYYKSLKIKEKIFGTDHPDIAISYHNIGLVYDDQGDRSEALNCYYKSMIIREKCLGTNDLDTAVSYRQVGIAYFVQSYYYTALEYLEKAMRIFKDKLDDNHSDILNTLEWIDTTKVTLDNIKR